MQSFSLATLAEPSASAPQKFKNLGCQKKTQFSGKWLVNKKTDKRLLNDIVDQYKHLKIREDWDQVRDSIMKKALQAKFTQDQTLKTLLLETGDSEIIEASPRDSYCGWGPRREKQNGLNKLGKLLMEIRQQSLELV